MAELLPMRPPTPSGMAFTALSPPDPGSLLPVAPGVHWLRMPLPMALDHINLWVLTDGDGWTLVDTGLGTETTFGIWERLLTKELAGRPVRRVLVTHMHPDHVGAAGWLLDRCGVELYMTRSEFLQCRNLVADTHRPVPETALRFYRAAGWNERQLVAYRQRFGMFGRVVAPLPSAYCRLEDDSRLLIDGREWRVLVGRGHSPEHACLLCSDLNLLISGDQVLPTISSNVSVWPTEPHADPLAEWLQSCAALRAAIPEHVRVLPSHGLPFTGVRQRLGQLIEHHEDALERLRAACTAPTSAVGSLRALFARELDEHHFYMATGEGLAHLHYLLYRGELAEERRGDVRYFRRRHTA